MSSSSRATKAMQLFKPFDGDDDYEYEDQTEYVLHVQSGLFPFGTNEVEDKIHEIWYVMFTNQRFIICKLNEEGMIIERKQLNYRNIIQFKLKKNKRFKKSNLPSIKVYVNDKQNDKVNNNNNQNEEDDDNDKYPKVIISFNNTESRDKFHTKMIKIIQRNHEDAKDSKSSKNSSIQKSIQSIQYEIYETLSTIIKRQNIYNQYLKMSNTDSMEIFRFLEPAQKQAQQMTDITNNKYMLKVSNDDIKHISAYYRTKPDNFQIRNNRKQWFINSYIACKLFQRYFPCEVSEELQWIWIQQICRSSIYFIDDPQMNMFCKELIDILCTECFQIKYITVIDTFWHQQDYQNLEILLYVIQNYINLKSTNLDNLPKLRYKQMIPLLIKNNQQNSKYTKYFIQLINIPILKQQFKESDIYQCILQYLSSSASSNNDDDNIENLNDDPMINAFCDILKGSEKKLNKIWPENSLYLQEIIKTEIDETMALKRIQISLMLNPKLLHKTYPKLYDGMTPLQFAEKKHVWSRVIQFLKDQVEGFMSNDNMEHLEGFNTFNDENKEFLSDSAFSEDQSQSRHHSMFFSSLLMNELKEKDKEKLAAFANNHNDKLLENRITKELIKIESFSKSPKSAMSKSPKSPKSPISPIKASPKSSTKSLPKSLPKSPIKTPSQSQWAFTNFVGQCFSFTTLSSSISTTAPHTNKMSSNHNNNNIGHKHNNNDLQRRLQSYITTLEKFKTKTRNLEHRLSKLNKTVDKQNEKILQLKLENKMIKNVYLDQEFKNNHNDHDQISVNIKLINSKQWKKWTYSEVIHWITTLENGRFKRYKDTLTVNMKLRNISGKHFARIDKSDLTYFYGIIDFDDVCDLYQQIQDLMRSSYSD